jgi:hypothetical protein
MICASELAQPAHRQPDSAITSGLDIRMIDTNLNGTRKGISRCRLKVSPSFRNGSSRRLEAMHFRTRRCRFAHHRLTTRI